MRIGLSLVSGTVLSLALIAAGGQTGLAQAGRTWVDPPAEGSAPAQPPPQNAAPPAQPPAQAAVPAPSPEPKPSPEAAPAQRAAQPAQAAPPPEPAPPAVAQENLRDPDEEKRAARANAAQAFAISYLNSWSSPNEQALEATAEFYAPRVLYHGRTVSMKTLFNEKRRFARRWPERDYRPRQDSMGITCNPPGEICTVHTVFDYLAANPARRRSTQGTGALQLIVNFIGEKPVIVAEHSTLLGLGRKRNIALEGGSYD